MEDVLMFHMSNGLSCSQTKHYELNRKMIEIKKTVDSFAEN